SSRRRHTRFSRDWSSDVCSSDLPPSGPTPPPPAPSPTPVPDEGDSSAPTPTTPTPSATPEDDEETGDAGDAGDDESAGSAVAPRSEERRVGQERQGSEAASAVKE